MNHTNISQKFEELYGSSPLLVRSPGRINLIGEHTDYNEGFVLPAAIDKEMIIAVAKSHAATCRLYSYDLKESFEFGINKLQPSEPGWANYIMGVVDQLQKAGYTVGNFDCVFGGDIPIGSGLSSSAALECAAGFALAELFNLQVERTQMARYAQLAEHTFAGVMCGIMDQFASLMGRAEHALRLDCRSLEFSYFPIHLKDFQLVLCDTRVKHSLASSEYNTRRMECEQGVAAVQALYPEVHSLRDVTPAMLEEVKLQVEEVVYRRCRYVLEENERLLTGCELLESGDIVGFGKKMYGSHEGLSNMYEVSCPELDFLVAFTKETDAVVGSRMMGGGFGGCTINLVAKDEKEAFIRNVTAAYKEAFDIDLETYEVSIADGTSVITGA